MLTSRIEMQPAGLIRLVEPLIAAGLRRDVESGLGTLKDLLEASPKSGGSAASGVDGTTQH
jgi:hypothetical protein